MVQNFRRDLEIIEFLFCNLPRVRAHDEMHLVCLAIDLLKQSLQIDRSACTGRGEYQFHIIPVISSEAEGEVQKSLDIPNISQRSSTTLDMIEKEPGFINTGLQPSNYRSTRN
jgi:hypothetical protein